MPRELRYRRGRCPGRGSGKECLAILPVDPRETRISALVAAIRALIRGGSNVTGQVTLTINVATTTVSNDLISPDCHPQLTPASSAGATEMGNGTIYVSSVAKGSFVITHANAATAGRTFNWIACGG